MPHKTTVVEKKSIGPDITAVLVRCCDDPATDAWHTIHWLDIKTPEQIAAEIDAHHVRVAARHIGKMAGDEHIATLVGDVQEHDEQSIALALQASALITQRPPSVG